MPKKIYSEKRDLILKSREAALSAVQIFNNPLTTFKSEAYIVLFVIAWTYLLHAYYRSQKVDYRHYEIKGKRKKYNYNPDGTKKYWELRECLSKPQCPLDKPTIKNLQFLIGLRNQIEHRKAFGLDSYLSARYQACALNYNYYLKKLFGNQYGLDKYLGLSLQFAELDYIQAKAIKDKEGLIPKEIQTYIAEFDRTLTDDELKSERYAYRLLFTKVLAKREGQADRVVEFLGPDSPDAANIPKEYWVQKEVEKPKFGAHQVIAIVNKNGFPKFGIVEHTNLWKSHDAKNPNKGFAISIGGRWFWYQNWIEFVLNQLRGI